MNRREFIASSAAIGSGLLFAASEGAPGAPPPSDTLAVGLIGAGAQGQALLETCLAMPGIRFRAVCDIWKNLNLMRASSILTTRGVEHATYTDYREMLDKEKGLQAVIVATPDCCHADHAIACLTAGVPVYCESPLSTTIDGARRMVRAAREAKQLLQIGYQRRSDPRYLHCAEKLLGDVKLLGAITAVNAQWNQSARPDPGWPKRYPIDDATLAAAGYPSMRHFRNWRWYKNLGGGPLAFFGSHQIDAIAWFLNAAPKRILATGGIEHHDRKTHELPDVAMAMLEYPAAGGRTIRAFHQILSSNGNLRHFEKFLGDQGTLIVSELDNTTMLYREATAPDWDRWVDLNYLVRLDKKPESTGVASSVTESVPPSRYALPIKAAEPWCKPHLDNFFNAIRGSAKLACPPETAYQAAITIAKINEAMETGRPVECAPEDFVA
jgi:predicted dehydrogenase